MNIKTKFDIGQKVWSIDLNTKYYGTKRETCHWCIDGRVRGIIVCVKVSKCKKEKQEERYRCGQWGTDYYPYQLFLTKANAQAECDRRNKR